MRVRCPDEWTRTLYLDGELSPGEHAEIDAHLPECARCEREFRALRVLDVVLAPGADERLPVPLAARALAIPDEALRPRRGLLKVAVAAAVLVAVATTLPWSREPDSALVPSPPSFRAQVLAALSGPEEAWPEELGDSALVVLHRIATGDDEEAARAAIGQLAAFERMESIPALCRAAAMPDRRREAVRALGALGGDRALRTLAPLLLAGELDEEVVPALVRIGGDGAAELLSRREDLVTELARVGGRTCARKLLELSARDARARAALRTHGEMLMPDLLALASGPDGELALDALEALRELALPGAEPALAALLEKRELRGAAARALAAIDTREAAASLVEWARDPEVRNAFRGAGPGAEAWLIARLTGSNPAARFQAVDLLGRCGGPLAVRALLPLARKPALAPAVLTALGRIGGERGIAALELLAERPRLSRAALEALAETSSEGAVDVIARIGRRDRALRGAALAALGRIPSPRAVEAILVLDLEPGRRLGNRAIRSLEGMDRDVVEPALAALLAGDLGPAARAALRELGAETPGPVARGPSLY